MAKKLENMTTDERIAYFAKQRAFEEKKRRDSLKSLNDEQRSIVFDLHKQLQEVLDTALDVDMGGLRALPLYDMQELQSMADRLHYQFNLGGK
tara:strand:+ start:180 stop:458 length:279 start_codon:yes stop_codon:yes gene_type:complete